LAAGEGVTAIQPKPTLALVGVGYERLMTRTGRPVVSNQRLAALREQITGLTEAIDAAIKRGGRRPYAVRECLQKGLGSPGRAITGVVCPLSRPKPVGSSLAA